jgi:hypothetical protein
VYNSGVLSASAVPADFISFGGPNQILNYTGPVTYSVQAVAAGAAANVAGVITQALNGEIVFKHNNVTVLDVVFMGAIDMGNAGSNSTGTLGDTQLTGQTISYSADSSVVVGPFVPPNSFSIALTQVPGISISGANLANFTASASGTFGSSPIGGGASPPTPLPRAAAGGPALIAGLLACRWMRRRKLAT